METGSWENSTRLGLLRPEDLFRYPWKWRPVSREEALAGMRTSPVVVVQRIDGQERADWLDETISLQYGAGAFDLRGLSYYQYASEPAAAPGGGGGGGGDDPIDPPPPTPVDPPPPSVKKTAWIEIELKDADGRPVAGEPYRVTAPDGVVREGTLDGNGRARIEGLAPGNCQVTFPELDQNEWGP